MSLGVRRFWQLIWTLTAIYWVFLCVMTHLPPDKVPKTDVSDKTEHVAAYGLLAGMLHLCLWPRRWSILKTAIIVMCIIMAFAALDEITQPIVGRTCDIYDWTADTTGAAVAIVVMTLAYSFLPASPRVPIAAPSDPTR